MTSIHDILGRAPSDLTVARAFDVGLEHVNVAAMFNQKTGAFGFTVSINHPERPGVFDLIHDALAPDSQASAIDCRVFGTRCTRCTLAPKLPACAGCPLA